jgi:dephospho-CoA kinase
MQSRRLIGLTGGISTGKTTVANHLANAYKLPVLDTDIYAREAVQIGSPILELICQRYGQDILFKDGNLNRLALGEVVFNNRHERRWLEAQIHPYVINCLQTQAQIARNSVVVMVIPLLFEANLTHLVTEIWVVKCKRQQQLARLIARDNLTPEQALERIKSQLPLRKKIAAADIVLDNSSNLTQLLRQVDLALTKNPIKLDRVGEEGFIK